MNIVKVHRYDLSQGMANQLSAALLGRHMRAIWHTGVSVFGKEYYFDGGVGIEDGPSGETRFGRPLEVDTFGASTKTQVEFEAWNQQQMANGNFGPNSYKLLECNCNHYTDAAIRFLMGPTHPGIAQEIKDMIPTALATPFGQMLRPMLESMTSAPTNQTGFRVGGDNGFQNPFNAFAQAANGGMSNGFGTQQRASPQQAPPQSPFTTNPFPGVGRTAVPTPSTTPATTTLKTVSLPASLKDDLDLHLAILQTDDTFTKEQRITCIKALHTICANIVADPSEGSKVSRISTASEFFKNRLGNFTSARDILEAIGFVADSDGVHLVFRGTVGYLPNVVGTLIAAERELQKGDAEDDLYK